MDSAPYSINESSSVKRCYRFFRTMGLRHLVVVNAYHKVTGMITRNDVTQHRMQSHWVKEVIELSSKFTYLMLTCNLTDRLQSMSVCLCICLSVCLPPYLSFYHQGDNMSRFVNIDNVMEPAQISQNSNQDSVPSRDSTRGEHSRSTSHQSPSRSWTGVRSLLGGDRGNRGKEGGTDGPLSLQSQDTNLSSLPSDPALSSSSSSTLR